MAEKTDPVCGQSIDALRARAVAIVAGERYYFCSVEHRELFAADPARYVTSLRPEPAEVVVELAPAAASPPPVSAAHTVRFEIGGMTGSADEERVRRAILRVAGVEDVSVDRVTDVAKVTVAPAGFRAADLVEAVATAGFEASARSTRPRRGLAGDALLAAAGVAIIAATVFGHWSYAFGLATLAALLVVSRRLARYARQAAQAEIGALEPLPEVAVRPGELVRVAAPEVVLVDGVIKSGEAVIDETATGGATEEARDAGDPVVAGTRVVRGSVVVEVRRAGAERAIDRLRVAVVELAVSPSSLVRLATRLERWAAPVALAAGGLAFAVQLLLGHGLAAAAGALGGALVALGPLPAALAVGPALAIAGARAARKGVLFRNSEALVRAAGAGIVVLDRATLVEGRRAIEGVAPAADADVDERQLVALAAAVEGGREGPLARALRAHADELGVHVPPIDDFRTTPGRGISAIVAGRPVAVGPRRLAEAEGVEAQVLDELSGQFNVGTSAVYVLADRKLAGIVGVGVRVRDAARALVAELRERGVRVVLLTGDEERAAATLAADAGIDEVQSGLGPDGKKRAIAELRASAPVAAIGDSVDDAPALAAADVGIAVARGAALELAAGGVTVLRGDLEGVATALALARRAAFTLHAGLGLAVVHAALALAVLAGASLAWLAVPLACASTATVLGVIVLGADRLRQW